MSMKWHDATVAGTPEVSTIVQAGDNRPVTSSAVKSALDTFVRPNLLDNWYFVGGGSQQGGGQFPINQRGQTVYNVSWNYTIDRWKTLRTLTVYSDGITPGLSLQPLETSVFNALSGKVKTVSALCSDGTLATFTSSSDNFLVTESEVELGYGVPGYGQGNCFDVSTTTKKIVAVKLELGSDQTLAHQENGVWVLNEIPNYQQELAKCQRYYIRIYDATMMMAQFAGDNTIRCQIPVANLAKTPTVTATNFYIYTESGAAPFSISSIVVRSFRPNNILVDIVPTTAYSATNWRQLCVSANGDWEISAEL